MPDASDTRTLLLSINATTEVLRTQLSAAEKSVAHFTEEAEGKFAVLDHAIEATSDKMREVGAALGLTAGLFAVEGLIEAAHRGLEYAASLGHVSEQLGVTTRDLQVFRFAASQVGISNEDMEKGLQKFTKSLGDARTGGEAAIKIFKALGFTNDEIAHLDVHDALIKTAQGISEVHDRATRSKPEIALFGRAGQQLDPLFREGAAGIREFSEQADKLGLIIPDEFIEKAHTAEARVKTLQAQLSVNIAGIVAQNADAIITLANALGALATKAVQAGNGYNGLVRIYQHEGFGAVLKSVQGDVSEQVEASTTEGYAHRAIRQYNTAIAAYHTARADPGNSVMDPHYLATEAVRLHGVAVQAVKELQEERGRAAGAEAVAGEGGGRTIDLSNHRTPRARRDDSAEKAAAAEKREAERRKRVNDEAGRLDDQALGFEGDLTANLGEQLSIARTKVETDHQRQLADLDQQVIAKQVTREEAKGLRSRINDNAVLAQQVIDRRADAGAEQQAFALAEAQLSAMRDLLGVNVTLAGTRKERLALELDLLAAEKAAERDRLTHTINDRDRNGNLLHSDSEIAVASANLGTLDSKYDGKAEETKEKELSPIDAYRRQLHEATDDTNDALQNVGVHALQGLDDQLSSTLGKVLGLKGGFGDLAASIIADLAKIEIEKAILASTDGASGGLFGAIAGLFGGGRAAGGDIDPSKFYLVGENGPELFAPGRGGSIVPNHALRAPTIGPLGGAARLSHEVTAQVEVNASPLLDARVQGVAIRTVASAAEPIMAGAESRTVTRLRRPSLPGGWG